ncbi:MAG: succinate dehydrogenase cytochrome b subunit [Cytophagaceae bacterium]|nr:succinate dehydrogenase cytochrome b subunit [Cytophagaceae bacterium]MDW8457259.1 succinate dehydrogenase cytochrome b subunit [Cytophagaceae bacterium]
MSWLTIALTSSLGKKFITGVTGLFLCSFLVVHCGVNALIFLNDGGETFNKAAEFMGTNFFIRTMEIVLFLGIILHIVQALTLEYQNNKARPIKYAVKSGNANSKWYSRSMGLLGTLILIFLILHLKHFWVESRFTDHITSGKETLFGEMKEVFSNVWVVIIYCLSMVSLAYHLLHGFASAFQTLGLNHKKYTPFIKKVGVVFSIVIPLLFALMPVAVFFQIIK